MIRRLAYAHFPETHSVALCTLLGSAFVGLLCIEFLFVYWISHKLLYIRPSPIIMGLVMGLLWTSLTVAAGSAIAYFLFKPSRK